MSVSGLVITLEPDPARAEPCLRALAADPRLTLGERHGHRLSAVADTPDVNTDRTLIDDLRAMPGVAHVDVVFVSVDEAPLDCPPTQPRSLR